MAAATRILPISNEKFKKTLSWPMSSCASLSLEKVVSSVARPRSPDISICVSIRNGVPFFYSMKDDPETKDRIASLNEFVRSRSTPDDAPEEIIAAALIACRSGKYTAPIGYVRSNSFNEDDVGMGTASRPPMVINDDNGKTKARTMNDVVAGSPSEHENGLYSKASPSAPPLYEGYPVFTAGKGKGVEDDVGMGTANYPPMVINNGNGKARTMNDVVASSSEHKYGLFRKYAPSAPPCEQYSIPVLTAGKGKACIEASPVEYAYYSAAAHRSFGDDLRKAARDAITPAYIGHPSVVYHRAPSRKVQDDIEASPLDAYDIYNGNYSAAARRFYDDFGNAAPSAIAPSDVEYPSLLDEDDDDVIENKRYCCFGGNAGGGSSGEASTSSFKNVKDRDEASSAGSGSIAPKRMKKMDNNFDTGVDCMAGFPGCVPFKFKVWVKRSKDKVYD